MHRNKLGGVLRTGGSHTRKICEPQHMVALRMRRIKAKSGSLVSFTRDLSRPPCVLIHCSCAQCQIFCQDSETWQPGSCRTAVGCKCPQCRLYYDSTGHWDPKRAANAELHCILPLSEVGCLQLSINGLPVTESFLSAPLSH